MPQGTDDELLVSNPAEDAAIEKLRRWRLQRRALFARGAASGHAFSASSMLR